MAFRLLCLSVLLSAVIKSEGASVPSLADCSEEFIKRSNVTIERDDRCDAIISSEVKRFYDEIHNWIENGVNANVDNRHFVEHEQCIINNLRHFNVTDLFFKGIAYRSLNSVYPADYSVELILKSKLVLLYALQLCEPRTLYERYPERITNFKSLRVSNAQARCLLNHVNENSVREPYQFENNTEPSDSLDLKKCFEVVRMFIRKYYYVLDLTRSVSIFGLKPSKVLRCREDRDKSYIDNIILLTIFRRLSLTPEQHESEMERYFEIAKDEARNFFLCMPMYE